MMTDKQLKALMEWMWAILRGSANLEKRAMYEAFGFVEGEDGWPTVPTHPQTLPPANPVIRARDYDEAQDIATWGMTPEGTGPSDPTATPEQHKEEIANADYDAKHEALSQLIISANANGGFKHLRLFGAADIMQYWPELKAIMEPNNDAK